CLGDYRVVRAARQVVVHLDEVVTGGMLPFDCVLRLAVVLGGTAAIHSGGTPSTIGPAVTIVGAMIADREASSLQPSTRRVRRMLRTVVTPFATSSVSVGLSLTCPCMSARPGIRNLFDPSMV